jgi:pyruvate/2-oxoglutarate dehydrogenase complex dihydrolipoamide acyltransferase (E2) component
MRIGPAPERRCGHAASKTWDDCPAADLTECDSVPDIKAEKPVVEIESPATGILAEILADDGATVPMGASIGIVREAP